MTEQKANLICFPSIKKVSVYNYPLFDYLGKDHFTIDWKDGLNLVLGANSIGKSTFLNMVIYGIVGEFTNAERARVNPSFFLERLREKQIAAVNQNWKIEVTFSIGDMELCVTRNLRNSTVEKLTKNGIKLDKDYPSYLKKHTKIYSFDKEGKVNLDNLAFVLKYLVIREEESNYLLWEKEKQAKIFSILFNEVGVHTKIENLEKECKDKKDDINTKEEVLSNEVRRLNELLEKQKEEFGNKRTLDTLQQNLTNFTNEKQQLEDFIKGQTDEATSLRIRYDEKNRKHRVKKTYLEQLKQNKWNIEQNIKILEDANDALSSQLVPCIVILKSELERNTICNCCNTKVSILKSEEILNKIQSKKCPVCDSVLEKAGSNKTKEQIIEEITRFKRELSSIETKIQAINQQCERLQIEKKDSWKILTDKESECYSKREKIAKLEDKIEELRINISDFRRNGNIFISRYDEDIEKQQRKVQKIQEEISKLNQEKESKQKELTIKRTAFNKKIKSMENDISKKFAKYTKEFFRTSRLEYRF